MIRKAAQAGLSVAAVVLLAAGLCSTVSAAAVPRLIVLADIDGDGKQDSFYRTSVSKNYIEFGVRLTSSRNKYVKIFDTKVADFNRLVFKPEKRRDFIREIGCVGECSDWRINAIKALENSTSVEVLDVYTEESAGSVILMTKKGKVIQEWYSD